MTFHPHAKRFLTSFGITPEAVDCEQTYSDLMRNSQLKDAVEATAHQMLTILGYKLGRVQFTYRDGQTPQQLCRLIGAPLGEVMPERERDILHYLAEAAATLRPGQDYDFPQILSDIVSEHCDRFQNLANKLAGLPIYSELLPRNKGMESLAMVEAILAARALAKQYRIPMGPRPHPVIAELMPEIRRQETKEQGASISRAG